MQQYNVDGKIYNVSEELLETFKNKYPNAIKISSEEPGKIQPQVTGAPVEETAAPDTASKLENISLDLLPPEAKFTQQEIVDLKSNFYEKASESEEQTIAFQTYGEYYDSGLASPQEQKQLEKLISIYGRDYKNPIYRQKKNYEDFLPQIKKSKPNISEEQAIEQAKQLYVEQNTKAAQDRKIVQFLNNKSGFFSNWDEKDTYQTRVSKLAAEAKTNAEARENALKEIKIDFEKSNQKAKDLISKEYTTQQEVDQANEELESIKIFQESLATKGAELIDSYYEEIDVYQDATELSQTLGRTYADAGRLLRGAAGTTISLASGALRVPEFLPAVVAEIIDPKDGTKKVREFANKYMATSILANLTEDVSENILNDIGEVPEVQNIKNISDVSAWATNMIGTQIPILTTLAIAPHIGLELIATSTLGQKYEEIGEEIEEGEDYNALQIFSAPILNAAAEYATERITLNQIKGVGKALSGITKKAGEKQILKTASKYINDQIISGAFFKDLTNESVSEGIAQLSQNATDNLVLGKNNSLWEGVPDALASGAFISASIKAPAFGVKLARPFIDSRSMNQKVFQNAQKIEKLQTELQKKSLSTETRDELRNKKTKLVKENFALFKNEYENISNFTKQELNDLIDLDVKVSKVANQIAKVRQDANLDEDVKTTLINDLSKDAQQNINEKLNIVNEAKKRYKSYNELTDEQFEKAFKRDEQNARRIVKAIDPDSEVIVVNNFEEQKKWLDENTNLNEDQKNSVGFGQFVTRASDGIEVAIMNKDQAKTEGVITTGQHEAFHKLLSAFSKADPESVIRAGKQLYSYVAGNINIEDFATSEFANRFQAYKNKFENGEIKEQDLWEETFTLLSESIKNGDIKFKETTFTKIGDIIRRALQSLGWKQVKFNTGRDAYNFVKDYNKSFEKGGLNKAQAKFAKLNIPATIKEVSKASLSEADNADIAAKFKQNPDRVLTDSKVTALVGKVATAVTKRFFDRIPEDARAGITRDEYKETAETELLMITREWNPDKQDLGKFLANRGFLRLSDLATRLGIESTYTEGFGIMENVEASQAAQAETEEIIEPTETEDIQADQKDTLLEAVDVKREVDGKTYEEHVTLALEKNIKLAVNKYTDQISANRTVTPFVASVKEGLADDLRVITKKFINEYGYENFLKDYKKAILQNFTTTYLSKHPLFRKGIEKSSGGKMGTDAQGNKVFEPNFFLPKETKPNKFEWVDENGKKLKIDRDNAGARGLTSGPEIMRRSKKINSIITDNEFIDYHFQDGALRKKKKQNPEDALARQLASEIGFDLLKLDLNTGGDIYKKLQETAELFDIIIAEAEMQKLAKDLDRGAVKFSLSGLQNNLASENVAFEILTKSIIEVANGNPALAEVITDIAWARSFPTSFKDIILPGLKKAVENAASEQEQINIIKEFLIIYSRPTRTVSKLLNLGVTKNAWLLKTIKNELGDLGNKLIGERGGNKPIRIVKKGKNGFIEIQGETLNYDTPLDITQKSTINGLLDGRIAKEDVIVQNNKAKTRLKKIIFDNSDNPGLTLATIKLLQKDNRSIFRQAATLNGIVQNYKGDTVYEHNPPVQYVYEQIEDYLVNPTEAKRAALMELINTVEANIVPVDFAKIVDADPITKTGIPKDGTKRYDKALAETNYTFDTSVSKFSLSAKDTDRMNLMISETGKVSIEEISEVTATRLGKTKGKFGFFIPPSADDFMGLMYYMLRKGNLGDQDLQFIKEKLIAPFTKGQAAFDSYKLQTLQQFREFKKLIRKVPKAKLSFKNDLGFTNEEAVRVYIWNKQGVDIFGISKNEVSSLVKLVEGNADLLSFANNISNLLAAQGGYPAPQENWFGGSITIDVLEHINEISRKEFFAEFNEAADFFFGKLNNRGEIQGPIANKLRAAYGDNYIEALSDILYRMKNGRAREFGKNKLVNQLNNWISNSVGAVMFLNARSALLQQVSLVNFINLSDNNPIKFAAAIANPKQYWADYLTLLNSDYLVQRRSGIKIDVNQDELVKAAESGRNPIQSVISLILKKGFVLTTWGDSHAIATGGATLYRNRINTYLNDGLSQAEAEAKAFDDFKELAEESQQSSRPDRISKQQASTIGRLILAWANTPMQYARITKKAALDLINGRGDWKTNTSKLIYYGAIQNLMFTYLQQGLFAMIFDGEDQEEEDAKKYEFAFNSMADGFLRGLGFGGAIAATSKNMVLEAIDQAKGRGNYDEVVWEALKLSPPLGSKISKARAVGRTFGWKQEREKVFTEGFSLDNPAFEAVGKAVSATTNIPLDRVVRKLDNITYPMRHDVEFWQAAALYLGWGQWELGLKDVNKRKKEKKKLKIKKGKYIL